MSRTIYSNPRGIILLIKETYTGVPVYKAYRHRGRSLETTNIDTAYAWLS